MRESHRCCPYQSNQQSSTSSEKALSSQVTEQSIQFNAKLLPTLHPLFLLQGLPLLPLCLLILHCIRSSGSSRRSGRLACGHANSLCGPQGQERGQGHSPAGNSSCRWNATTQRTHKSTKYEITKLQTERWYLNSANAASRKAERESEAPKSRLGE